jgi:ParB family chromosome partitioning protein
MVNRKALGRGLKALIPDAPSSQDPSLSGNPIEYAEVDKITPNPFQPRETFDPEKLEDRKSVV